jgi:hypothetical protein
LVALLPVAAVAVQDPFERGNLALLHEEVEPFQDLVNLFSHEGFDSLDIDSNLLDVTKVVLLRTGLEAAQTGVAEDLLHGGEYTQ